jgi:hypothetical protein
MRRCHVPLAVCLAFVLVPAAVHADPVVVKAGKVVLPITGLVVDLPRDARKNASWSLSGSWSLSDGGKSFDGRDVIDLKLGDKLIAGTWVHIGYFNAGECASVVKELAVPDQWQGEADLYGQHFQVAGGTWDFENDLGKHPAIAMCTPGANGQSLLLYRFFLEDKAPTGQAGVAALAKDKLLEQVTRAWKAGTTALVFTTRHPEIKRRGDIEAARTVTLAHNKLDLALPDDGFVWLARASTNADDPADFLDRMAPSLPDLTLEIVRISDMPCDQALAPGDGTPPIKAEPPPSNVPLGWTAFPTFQVDGNLERLVCHQQGRITVIVGLLVTPASSDAGRDFAPLAPLLGALVDAAAK